MGRRGLGPVPLIGRAVWFIDVGDGPEIGAVGLAKRLRGLLDEMARADLSTSPGRVLPLIALPVLAIGEGGLNSQRGEVIVELLRVLTDFVSDHDMDVAVVTPDRSVFAAVQHQRGRREEGWTLDDVALSEAHRLGELARTGQLALMIGAGASVPAGMPSWDELVKRVGEELDVPYERISRLDALDQAELLSRKSDGALGELVARVMPRPDARPSLAHVLLAGLRCREALTTNYDDFYERAMRRLTRREPTLGVVPATVGAPADRWLLEDARFARGRRLDRAHPPALRAVRRAGQAGCVGPAVPRADPTPPHGRVIHAGRQRRTPSARGGRLSSASG